MSNIIVNSLDGQFSKQISSKASVKSGEDFSETLKGVSDSNNKVQAKSKKSEAGTVEKDEPARDVKKYENAKKREAVKQKDEPTDEQIAAAMEEVASQVKEFIQEKFNVTSEELEGIMSDLGITDIDLTQVAALTKLVKKLDGIEKPQDVLTNQNFNQDLKELLKQVEEIKNQVMNGEKVVFDENLQIYEDDLVDTKEIFQEAESIVETEEIVQGDADTDIDTDTDAVEVEIVEEAETDEQVSGQSEIDTQETPHMETTTGNETKQEFKQNDNKMENNEQIDTDTVNVNAVRPEDFATRLTEDLSGRVGDRQAITIVRQVVEQVSMQTKQGMTTMELQLYPAHLGRVVVQLVSKDGQVTAQITAETEAAKNALEGQLTLLKENLNNQGVRIESIEVTIASHAFEQNMQGEKGQDGQSENKNRGKRVMNILDDEIAIEDEIQPEIMEVMGNTVDYSA